MNNNINGNPIMYPIENNIGFFDVLPNNINSYTPIENNFVVDIHSNNINSYTPIENNFDLFDVLSNINCYTPIENYFVIDHLSNELNWDMVELPNNINNSYTSLTNERYDDITKLIRQQLITNKKDYVKKIFGNINNITNDDINNSKKYKFDIKFNEKILIDCKGLIFNPYLILYINNCEINDFIKNKIKKLKVQLCNNSTTLMEFDIFSNLYLCKSFKLNLKIKKNKIKIPLIFLRTFKFPLFLLEYDHLFICVSYKCKSNCIKGLKIKILNQNYNETIDKRGIGMAFPFFLCKKQMLKKYEENTFTSHYCVSTLFMLLHITRKQNNKKFPKIKNISLLSNNKKKNINVEKIGNLENKFNIKIYLIPIHKKFNNEKKIKKQINKKKISNIRICNFKKEEFSFMDNIIYIEFDDINTYNFNFNLYNLHNNEYLILNGMGNIRYIV